MIIESWIKFINFIKHMQKSFAILSQKGEEKKGKKAIAKLFALHKHKNMFKNGR